MKKFAMVVLAVAVAAMFAMPVLADGCGKPNCNTCAKPCAKPCPKPCVKPCPKPCAPCVTCGQPSNVLQSTANAINDIQAPELCPKCSPCAKPAPCAKPCAKPCNTCK